MSLFENSLDCSNVIYKTHKDDITKLGLGFIYRTHNYDITRFTVILTEKDDNLAEYTEFVAACWRDGSHESLSHLETAFLLSWLGRNIVTLLLLVMASECLCVFRVRA